MDRLRAPTTAGYGTGAVATWRLVGRLPQRRQVATAPRLYRLHWLERQPRRELEGARPAGAEDLVDAVASLAKGRWLGWGRLAWRRSHQRIQPAPVARKVSDVENIERLGDQRKLDLLANRDQTRQTDILREKRISVGNVIRQLNERDDLISWRSGQTHLLAINKHITSRLLRGGCGLRVLAGYG